jgi:hypothetical protein
MKRTGLGCITSRGKQNNGIGFWQLLAFTLSEQPGQYVTVEAAKKAFEEGLIR